MFTFTLIKLHTTMQDKLKCLNIFALFCISGYHFPFYIWYIVNFLACMMKLLLIAPQSSQQDDCLYNKFDK